MTISDVRTPLTSPVTEAVVTEADVRECLRTVPEPCSLLMREPTNITDMGLLESVEIRVINSAVRVRVERVLTDPSCLHFGAMQRFITDALLHLDGVDEVEVRASTTVLWSPDRGVGGTA